jgi:hypothetical protein
MLKKFLNWLKSLFGFTDKHAPVCPTPEDDDFEYTGWIKDEVDSRDHVVNVSVKGDSDVQVVEK